MNLQAFIIFQVKYLFVCEIFSIFTTVKKTTMELNYKNRNKLVYFRNDNGDVEQCTYAEFVREFGGDETTTPNGVAPRKYIHDTHNDFKVREWNRFGFGSKLLSTYETRAEAEKELFEYWEYFMLDSDQTPYFTTDKNDTDI